MGLKIAGASCRAALAKVIDSLGYVSTKADPNVWIQLPKKSDKGEYY